VSARACACARARARACAGAREGASAGACACACAGVRVPVRVRVRVPLPVRQGGCVPARIHSHVTYIAITIYARALTGGQVHRAGAVRGSVVPDDARIHA
jgi:hypothetical protein